MRILLALLVASCASVPVNESIVSVSCEYDGVRYWGTGYVARKGLVVTARHVIYNCKSLGIKVKYIDSDELHPAEIMHMSDTVDVASLAVNTDDVEPIPLCYWQDTGPGTVYRYTYDEEYSTARVFVLWPMLYGVGEHGFSGSPIITDNDYCVTGILTRKFKLGILGGVEAKDIYREAMQ